MIRLLHGIILSCLYSAVWSYPNGAPGSTCLTMFPKHKGAERLETPCPFTISLSPTSYRPSQEIRIEISGPAGETFRGLQIRAHRVEGDTETIFGTFTTFPADKLKPLSCFGGPNNMLTHKNNDDTISVSLTWKAPDVAVGDLIFTATILSSFKEFWYDEKSKIITDLSSSSNLGSLEPIKYVVPDTKFDGCGTSIGCVLYPRHCSGTDCDVALSFWKDSEIGYVHFELMGKAEGYVSVGFSDDRMMTHDETVSCTAERGRGVTVQRGFNPGKFNERRYTTGIINRATEEKDGKIYCRFSRPIVMSPFFYAEGQPPKLNNITFDLNQDWYIMLAWGYTFQDTDVMGHHAELPMVTTEKVSLSSTMVYRGTSFNIYLQLHDAGDGINKNNVPIRTVWSIVKTIGYNHGHLAWCFAVVAWMLLVGLGTVIARHYRDGFGAKMLCGQKEWFQLHRLCVVLAFLLTATSFILIFSSLQDWSKYAGAHIYLGIAIMAATLLQVFAGLIRPSPSSKIRPIFNWAHRLLGKATHIAAAVEIYLAFDMKLLPSGVRYFGFIVVIVWMVTQVVWELLLEIVSCCKSRSSKQSDYDVSSNQFKLEEKYPEETNRLATVLFVLYALTILGVTVAALTAILLY